MSLRTYSEENRGMAVGTQNTPAILDISYLAIRLRVVCCKVKVLSFAAIFDSSNATGFTWSGGHDRLASHAKPLWFRPFA